jgi:uncharacterized protein (TIGR02996 family)
MTQDESFLAAISAEPDDDAIRLIYADWLMDQDEPSRADRGEFIRLQVERALLPLGVPEAEKLQQREELLLQRNWEAWIGPLRKLGKWARDLWLPSRAFQSKELAHFHRGFINRLSLHASLFLSHATDFLRLTPLVYLRLTGAGAHAAELAACPALAQIRQLDFIDYFVDPVDAEGMRMLARSPFLGRLKGLNLYGNNLGDAGVTALATADWFPQLIFLNLSGNGVSVLGLSALANVPVGELRQLELGGNHITDEGARVLARSPLLSRLHCLGLEGNQLMVEGCRELRSSPYLPALAQLKLQGNPGNE